MPHEYLDAVASPDQSVNPLFTFLGIDVESIAPDHAVLALTVKAQLIQGAGLAAGGVLATLLDEAMAHAALAGNQPGQFLTTTDLHVSYLRPVNRNDRLRCEATVAKRGKTIIFAEAVIHANEKPVAKASASFLILERKSG